MRRRRWAWAALVVASAGPFAIGLGFEHVYDDRYTLVTSPALDLPLPALLRALVRGDGAFPDASRPAMVLSAYLDRALFGSRPFGTHLTSLVLYVSSTFAAAALAFAVLRRRRAALAAAVIWAAMPVHAEAVVCASYREDLLATIGALGALALLLAPTAERHGWPRAAAFGALLALGLAGKESALVVVPLLALLAPPLGDSRADRRGAAREWAARRERSLVVGALVLVTYLAWRAGVWIEGDGVARAARPGGANEVARYVVWAATSSLVPIAPAPIHPILPPAGWLWWLPLGAGVAALAYARGTPAARAGVFLLVGALLTSPLIGPANERADRYLLVTTFGSACLASLVIDAVTARLDARRRRHAHSIAVAVLALALGGRSVLEARVWSSDLALFGHATAQVPDSAKAWQGLASAERRAGRLEDAERSLTRSLALDPERPETRLSSAYLALARGDLARARGTLEALRADGHAELPGMRRAWRCAFDIPVAEAPACVREEGR